jgi:hypothetical protein
MNRVSGRVMQVLELIRALVDAVLSALSIDWFWSVWLMAVVGVEIGITRAVPNLAGAGAYAMAVYLCGAGLTSALYATSYELIARRYVDQPAVQPKRRARSSSPPPPGETMIPGAVGLALATFGAFLFIALARRDLVILVVGLPVVLITAPLFALFAFGYTRGEPTIGSFAYRKMPWGLGAFLALAGFVLAARALHLTDSDDAVSLSIIAGVAAAAALGFNFFRNWRVRS